MKVLVIGGSNFIGWRLVKLLAKEGINIVVYNRGNHQRDYPKNATHVIGDRSDISNLKELVLNNMFDVVFDMCAFRAEQVIDLLPVFSGRIKRYVFISSAAGYLDNQILPLTEDAQCGFHHQWGPYGSGKFSCDKAILAAYSEYKLPVTIVRPSYVYGLENPIDREALLFDRISKGLPILIPYSGEGVIQLGNVDDLCDALLTMIRSKRGIGEIFNISGTEYITLNGLVALIAQIVGKEPKVYHVRPDEMGFTQRQLFPFENNTYFTSIQKFCDTFSWTPKKNLRQGLEEAYFAWRQSGRDIKTNLEFEQKAFDMIVK